MINIIRLGKSNIEVLGFYDKYPTISFILQSALSFFFFSVTPLPSKLLLHPILIAGSLLNMEYFYLYWLFIQFLLTFCYAESLASSLSCYRVKGSFTSLDDLDIVIRFNPKRVCTGGSDPGFLIESLSGTYNNHEVLFPPEFGPETCFHLTSPYLYSGGTYFIDSDRTSFWAFFYDDASRAYRIFGFYDPNTENNLNISSVVFTPFIGPGCTALPSTSMTSTTSTTKTSTIKTISTTKQSTTSSTRSSTTSTTSLPTPSGFTLLGCYTDTVNARTLSNRVSVPDGDGSNTIESCQATCLKLGYSLAGLEFAKECFCDNSIRNKGMLVRDGRCHMGCTGNNQQICGGPNGLSVYKHVKNPPPQPVLSSVGCYTDNPSRRVLSLRVQAQPSIEGCAAVCRNNGYPLAGVEFGSECFCGDTITNDGTPASGCNFPCIGNPNQICGGAGRINIYNVATTSNAPPAPTTSPTPQPAPQPIFKGCYTDSVLARTFSIRPKLPGELTIEKCTTTCRNAGYKYAGTEFGTECYCDNKFNNDGHAVADGCDMKCQGNIFQTCGGPNRLSVYDLPI